MTATTTNLGARAGALGPLEGLTGEGFRLQAIPVVAYAWLLAAGPVALQGLVNGGAHEHRGLPPMLHWLQDSALAVPVAAVAVVLAAILVARFRPDEPGERATLSTLALWVGLAAVLFAFVGILGSQVHGLLVGSATAAGANLPTDLGADGVYALEAGLLVLAPISLFAGLPWQGAMSTSRASRDAVLAPGRSAAADVGPPAARARSAPALAATDRSALAAAPVRRGEPTAAPALRGNLTAAPALRGTPMTAAPARRGEHVTTGMRSTR